MTDEDATNEHREGENPRLFSDTGLPIITLRTLREIKALIHSTDPKDKHFLGTIIDSARKSYSLQQQRGVIPRIYQLADVLKEMDTEDEGRIDYEHLATLIIMERAAVNNSVTALDTENPLRARLGETDYYGFYGPLLREATQALVKGYEGQINALKKDLDREKALRGALISKRRRVSPETGQLRTRGDKALEIIIGTLTGALGEGYKAVKPYIQKLTETINDLVDVADHDSRLVLLLETDVAHYKRALCEAHENELAQGLALKQSEEERKRLKALLGILEHSSDNPDDDFVGILSREVKPLVISPKTYLRTGLDELSRTLTETIDLVHETREDYLDARLSERYLAENERPRKPTHHSPSRDAGI